MSDLNKTCIKCYENKPLSEFRENSRMRDGHRNDCRGCELAAVRLWAEKCKAERHAAKLARIAAPAKPCRKCSQILSKEMFYQSDVNEDGFRNICIECTKIDSHENYAANLEKALAQARAWQQNNPEKWAKIRARARDKNYGRNPMHKLAQLAVSYAHKTGRLVRQSCLICDDPKTDAHHPSYEPENFLCVQYLCRKHHRRANRLPSMPKIYSKELDNIFEKHKCFPHKVEVSKE